MSLSQDPGVSRSLFGGDNVVNVGVMKIVDGHNFKIDISRIIDSLGLSGNKYRILITDVSKRGIILDTTTMDTYVVKKLPFVKDFIVHWNFEVSIS